MRQTTVSDSFPPKQRSDEGVWAEGRESTRRQGVQRAHKEQHKQLGNASNSDLKTHGKQSSHSCTMTCRSIELITCLPGTAMFMIHHMATYDETQSLITNYSGKMKNVFEL